MKLKTHVEMSHLIGPEIDKYKNAVEPRQINFDSLFAHTCPMDTCRRPTKKHVEDTKCQHKIFYQVPNL